MKRLTLFVLISIFIFTPQTANAEVPQYALYDHPNYTPVPWQAWTNVTFDGTKDTVQNGVTTYGLGQFTTLPGALLRVSGRCMFLTPAPYTAARLEVYYAGNLYPVYLPLAFTDDRTLTFSLVFVSGHTMALQLYYDNVPVNSVRCNILFEAVG
jgi:hypothetical protein